MKSNISKTNISVIRENTANNTETLGAWGKRVESKGHTNHAKQ